MTPETTTNPETVARIRAALGIDTLEPLVDVAHTINVHPRTVRRWMADNGVKLIWIGRVPHVEPADLRPMIRARAAGRVASHTIL